MDRQLASLIYYFTWLKTVGVNRNSLLEHADNIGAYLAELLASNPIARLWSENNWSRDDAPCPIAQIEYGEHFAAAVDAVFGVQAARPAPVANVPMFDEYVRRECRTTEERDAITADVNSFWGRLCSYMTPERPRAYGLAVGRVQSGKTRNYIGLMFKAIDNGYNTVIILTSKNSRLAVQTHNRVSKWFGDSGLNVPNYLPLSQVREDGGGVEWIGGQFSRTRIHVGVIIKNERGHLADVKRWLDGLGPASREQMKLLFIDDESDSATPNTTNSGEPLVDSVADATRYANLISQNCAEKGVAVSGWISGLLERDIPQETQDRVSQKLQHGGVTRSRLMSTLREDAEFKHDVGLDENALIGDQNWEMGELVHEIFNHRQRKNSPLNWGVLRDLLYYVFNVKQERSRINRSICEIVGESPEMRPLFNFGRLIYVGYTATPFANMLNEDPTVDPICPDCIKPLQTSSKYFGLQRIFGGGEGDCNMNIVRTIEPDEYHAWVEPLQNKGDDEPGVEEGCTDELVRVHNFAAKEDPEDNRSVEWRSLKDAIKWAFCTAAARRIVRLNGDHRGANAEIKYRWTTMLFNLSHLSNQEEGVHPVQQRLVQRYIDFVTKPEHRAAFIEECRELWRVETGRFTAQDFARACDGYGDIEDYPSADHIALHIRDWFLAAGGKVKVVQMNSATGDLEQANYYCPDYPGDILWIVCGGNAIARGLTLEGLTVSYYDRIKRSSAVDTITQMGRWFGYRPGYELLPRIWMTPGTIGEMKKICRVEESLHNNLADIFSSEDRSSIRTGRDVANVRYFGRRLSGRDANGLEYVGSTSKGVFEHVSDVGDRALAQTLEYFGAFGDPTPIPANCTKPFNTRHTLFWGGIGWDRIDSYITPLLHEYLAGASKYEAEGLLREVRNSQSAWNVVVGNPDPERTHRQFDEGVLAGFGIRNNTFRRQIGREVKLGNSQMTTGALLARMPDYVTDQALANLNNPRIVPGGMRHVEECYRLASADENLASLVNPTLLIDFIHGDDDRPYVQVSFYWYGHSEESYYKAIVSPRKSPILERALEIVKDSGYISFAGLCHRLAGEGVDLDENELRDQIREECQIGHPEIGCVPDEVARMSGLSSNVLYGTSWLAGKERHEAESVGDVIGNDLYHRIVENGWNNYSGRGLLDFRALSNAHLEYVMVYDWVGRQYEWSVFERRYVNWDPISRGRYISGLDLERRNDLEGAKAAYEEAVRNNYPPAEYRLAKILLSEIGEDYAGHRELTMRVIDMLNHAKAVYAPAGFLEGDMYSRRGDNVQAGRFYAGAVRVINCWEPTDDIQLCLARAYHDGLGGKMRNENIARQICEQVAASGNPDAEKLLRDWQDAPMDDLGLSLDL